MSENRKNGSTESVLEIRIERLNTEKTRKVSGSDTAYDVYFELSEYPKPEWRRIFDRGWKELNLTQSAQVEGTFLVLHCELEEVESRLLSALKDLVKTTNDAYGLYVQREATALSDREDVWKQERKDIEALAARLRFD